LPQDELAPAASVAELLDAGGLLDSFTPAGDVDALLARCRAAARSAPPAPAPPAPPAPVRSPGQDAGGAA